MSSRNRYLQETERIQAQSISQALFWAQKYCMSLQSNVSTSVLIEEIRKRIQVDSIDYISIVDSNSLQEVHTIQKHARCAVAVWVGKTRLIDNVLLTTSTNDSVPHTPPFETKESLS